jgi:hypothetical protein
LAATAAALHGAAAKAATGAHDGGPLMSLDLAEAMPSVVGRALRGGEPRGRHTSDR